MQFSKRPIKFFTYGINDMQTKNFGDCFKPQSIFGIHGNRLYYGGIIDLVLKIFIVTHPQYVRDIQIKTIPNYIIM